MSEEICAKLLTVPNLFGVMRKAKLIKPVINIGARKLEENPYRMGQRIALRSQDMTAARLTFSNYLSSIKSAQGFGIIQLAVGNHATQLCRSKGLHADEFVLIGMLSKLLQSPGLI